MFKFLIPFLIFLTACSYNWIDNEPKIVQTISTVPTISEYEDHYISNILGPMGIDEIKLREEYMRIKNIFIQIQIKCRDKWFLEYRQCLILELNSQIKTAWFSDEIDKKFQLLITSIEDEIRFIPHYLNLDQSSMPGNLPFGEWNEKAIPDCNVLFWTGVSHLNYMGNPTTTVVLLSYFDNFSRLEEIFPKWKYHKEQYKKNKTKVYSAHTNNPCSYWTFGPDKGNILFFIENEDLVYLFIHESEGAWSGEFDYSIFVNQKGTQKFTQVGNFHSRSGIIPYYAEFYPEHDKSSRNVREKILELYRNRVFLYSSYFLNQDTYITSSTIDLLEKSLK